MIYPNQWEQPSPGSFSYTYQLTSTAPRTFNLSIGNTTAAQQIIPRIGAAPIFGILSQVPLYAAGQPLSLQLQLGNSAVSFADLAGNSTGWRVRLVRPDGYTSDLGLMADWTVVAGTDYLWNMTVAGSLLTQVCHLRTCLHSSSAAS